MCNSWNSGLVYSNGTCPVYYPLNIITLVLTGSSTPDLWTVHTHHVLWRVPWGPTGPGQEHPRGRALLDIPFQSCESVHIVSHSHVILWSKFQSNEKCCLSHLAFARQTPCFDIKDSTCTYIFFKLDFVSFNAYFKEVKFEIIMNSQWYYLLLLSD